MKKLRVQLEENELKHQNTPVQTSLRQRLKNDPELKGKSTIFPFKIKTPKKKRVIIIEEDMFNDPPPPVINKHLYTTQPMGKTCFIRIQTKKQTLVKH